ncbi:hypothetical protein C483_00810 [Natrialba hulunbeirensis JCM 10989]|uniref:eCIS core domain-containing protein n=1 Tax=Natrialba hulunbeirensis JCM 10989 TaxID=1227493 RepID=M0AAI7_9EURY|nr:DUF4157 domain-containing protein [Natrialba hulunbeirensis]ELY95775.1 hypothetical protein C483_00810 [Natrialba hulunbeirensis JCM 10989]
MARKRKRKRKRKRASKSTDADESSDSQTKRRSSSSTRSKSRLGPLDGTAAFDQGIGDNINALTGRPEGFDAMVEANRPEFEPLPTGADAQIQRALEGTDTTQGDVPSTVLDVLGQGGTPLDSPIQRALEERMDADFSNVRIHTGAKAAEAADAIDAKAFTCGNDIVFNSGEYDTESPEGQHLLAHELAHVRQQTGAAISMMPQEGADLEIDPDPQLEREADEAAAQALSDDKPLVVNRMGTDVHIQRSQADDSIVSPSQLRKLVADHVDEKLEEHGLTGLADQVEQNTESVDELTGLTDQVEENTETIDDLTIDTDDFEELEAELDGDDLDESFWGQIKEVGPEAMNPFTDEGASNHIEGLVAAGLTGGAALATGGAALLPAAAAMMAPSIRNTTSDAVVGDGVNLSPEVISAIAQQVEELRAQDETGSDLEGVGQSRGDR